TLLVGRLNRELDERGIIDEAQYGFRAGRSTLDAIRKVMSMAEEERGKTWRTRRLCLAIALDVKNAFNSMPWEEIMKAADQAGLSPYLKRMIG
ncbi:reverse transcriptase domain-containing protein, partial [Enterococcus faecalis]|uniref:reverse transcriptase domain-containing protein n=1 Tax=Enterococcus faecalis TaxID=1351 RepID=UPI0022F0C77D